MINRVIITMGDPAGIGPEIVVKFFEELYKLEEKNLFIAVCGSKSVLQHYIDKTNSLVEIVEIEDNDKIKDLIARNGIMHLINVDCEIDDIEIGKVSMNAGNLSMKYLEKALRCVKNGFFDGVVTAPISKDAINLAGYKYDGHTGWFAEKTHTTDFGMVLKGNKITVVLNTTHVSMQDAVKAVKRESIVKKIVLAQRAKEELGIEGKIAVAGLNPHNGEEGLFGDEESREILPAVEEARAMGIEVDGPIVPDTLFVKMLKDDYNIAVVMYHDQGLIPMKMESFGNGVNITVGLPIVRTSVDHGTAFDIAGKGIAECGSLKEAVRTANVIINRRFKRENGEIKIRPLKKADDIKVDDEKIEIDLSEE